MGAIHARRQGSFARAAGTSHVTVSVPEALGVGIAVLGGMHVLAALTLARHAGFARLESWLPLGEVDWSRVLLAWIGLALCVLAPALYRGQRAAWVITVVALLVTMVPTAIVHPSPVAIALSLALVGLLLWFRRRFRAPARWMERPGGWVSALAPLAGAVVILVLSGLLIRHEFRPTLAGASWMKMVVYRLSGTSVTDVLGGTDVHPTHVVARAVVRLIPWVTWPLALLTVLRIAEGAAAPRARGRDRLRARGILARDGATGTAPMTLWPGNSVRPLLGNTAFCAFRVAYGQAVVLGEPIGAAERLGEALAEFDAYCNHRGWSAVYYAVSEANAEQFRAAGYQLLQIGVEAILPLTDLEFHGKAWQSTRSALHRAEREGIRFELHPGDRIPPATLAAIRESDQVWTQHHELPPREFVLGDLRKMLAPEVMVAVALDTADHVHAFASWLPVPARKGWVIDLMRRGEPAMSGIMEYLIAQSMIALKGRGAEVVSLATAPLAELDQNPDRSFVQGLLNRVFERVHHPYDFQALYEFKAKFQPSWEPVHLAYRKDAELPAIALALARAHLPEFGIGMLVATVGRGLADRLWTQAQAMRNAGDSEGD
ncbi:MAG: DUF2156 domain-containing protein [Candidatus Eisenbacteria bacterium]